MRRRVAVREEEGSERIRVRATHNIQPASPHPQKSAPKIVHRSEEKVVLAVHG